MRRLLRHALELLPVHLEDRRGMALVADGFQPDRHDVIGAAVCLVVVTVSTDMPGTGVLNGRAVVAVPGECRSAWS